MGIKYVWNFDICWIFDERRSSFVPIVPIKVFRILFFGPIKLFPEIKVTFFLLLKPRSLAHWSRQQTFVFFDRKHEERKSGSAVAKLVLPSQKCRKITSTFWCITWGSAVWPDYSIIEPLQHRKFAQWHRKFEKSRFNILPNSWETFKYCQRFLKLCQSGEIAPNLNTLVLSVFLHNYNLLYSISIISNWWCKFCT